MADYPTATAALDLYVHETGITEEEQIQLLLTFIEFTLGADDKFIAYLVAERRIKK